MTQPPQKQGQAHQEQQNGRPMPQGFNWRIMFWLALSWLLVMFLFGPQPNRDQIDLSYSQFKQQVQQDNVAEVTVKGNRIHGAFVNDYQVEEEKNGRTYSHFSTVVPSFGDRDLMHLLETHNVVINAEEEGRSWLMLLLINLLPWALIIGLFIYARSRMQNRLGGFGGGHDEREQTLNQILAEMDGFESHESVVVMAATNRPDVLDAALTRPGRFDRQITLDLPQKQARHQILRLHTENVPLADNVDLQNLAARTVGFSGAELKNLVNEAALLAGRRGKQQVDADDFDQARDKILLGSQRDEPLTEEEKRIVAYHEAGHALLARLLPGADPLQKVSIIPRGRALGATEQLPEEERHNLSRTYLLNRMAVMLGGRVAEQVALRDITSGAGDDLKKATQLARRMICQWGMSERLGAVTFRRGEEHVFLGREMTEQKDFSEHTARIIDEEIQSTIQSMEAKARQVLEHHRDKLDTLATALLEHETLELRDVNRLLGLDGAASPADWELPEEVSI